MAIDYRSVVWDVAYYVLNNRYYCGQNSICKTCQVNKKQCLNFIQITDKRCFDLITETAEELGCGVSVFPGSKESDTLLLHIIRKMLLDHWRGKLKEDIDHPDLLKKTYGFFQFINHISDDNPEKIIFIEEDMDDYLIDASS